ncbi:hypothetical protein CHI95_24660, partial [Providencia rettgeri]
MKKQLCALLLGLSAFSVYAEQAPIQLKSGPSNAG